MSIQIIIIRQTCQWYSEQLPVKYRYFMVALIITETILICSRLGFATFINAVPSLSWLGMGAEPIRQNIWRNAEQHIFRAIAIAVAQKWAPILRNRLNYVRSYGSDFHATWLKTLTWLQTLKWKFAILFDNAGNNFDDKFREIIGHPLVCSVDDH